MPSAANLSIECKNKVDPASNVCKPSSTIKSKSFSGWYTGDAGYDRYQLFHKSPRSSRQEELTQLPIPSNEFFPVVCLDGVFLLMRKFVWEQIPFDEQAINGFHFYDIDLSLRVAEQFTVGVITGVGLVHHTEAGGDYGNRWVEEAMGFHSRWKDRLPRSVTEDVIPETSIQKIWLDRLKDQVIDFTNRIRWVLKDESWRNPRLFYSVLKFFLYHPLRLRYIHGWFRKRQ